MLMVTVIQTLAFPLRVHMARVANIGIRGSALGSPRSAQLAKLSLRTPTGAAAVFGFAIRLDRHLAHVTIGMGKPAFGGSLLISHRERPLTTTPKLILAIAYVRCRKETITLFAVAGSPT